MVIQCLLLFRHIEMPMCCNCTSSFVYALSGNESNQRLRRQSLADGRLEGAPVLSIGVNNSMAAEGGNGFCQRRRIERRPSSPRLCTYAKVGSVSKAFCQIGNPQ